MRFRDIKFGMAVRVKSNANALTTDASNSFFKDSSNLISLQGKSGNVNDIDDEDNTIRVSIDNDNGMSSTWFDAIHLEAVEKASVDVKPVVKPTLTRKEELAKLITDLETQRDTARKELKELDSTFSDKDMHDGKRKDGVYSIADTKAMCLVIAGLPIFVKEGQTVEKLCDSSWYGYKFTLTTLKPVITFK